MLKILHNYCAEWGLEVNIKKTAVMVFNKSGRLLKDSKGFRYGNTSLPTVKEYCYLGILFTLSGSMVNAQKKLTQKGIRCYFSLKSIINLSSLTKTVIFKLFDSLILPVISYGCQVWFSETWFTRVTTALASKETLPNLAKDPFERFHLKFLKWTLGVSKKASNAAPASAFFFVAASILPCDLSFSASLMMFLAISNLPF